MHSLTNHDNECQYSINDSSLCIMGNQSGMQLLLSQYEIVIIFIGCNAHKLFFAALKMKWVVAVQEAVVGMSLAQLPRDAVNFSSIVVYNPAPLILPKMREQKLLTLSWCSFWLWGMECVASSVAYEGWQWLILDSMQPIATQINKDASLQIVDTLLTLISRMGQRVCLAYVLIIMVANPSRNDNHVPSSEFRN